MDMGGSSGSYGYGDFIESWVSDNSSRNPLEPLSYSFGSLLSSTSTDMSQVNNAQLDYNEVMNTTVVNRSLDSLVVPSFGANYVINDANLLLPFFHIPGIHDSYYPAGLVNSGMGDSYYPIGLVNSGMGDSYYPVGLVNSGMGDSYPAGLVNTGMMDSYPAGLNKLSCHSNQSNGQGCKRQQLGSMVSSGGAESAGFDVYQRGIGIETETQLSKKPRLDQDATKDVLLHPEINQHSEKSLVQMQEKNSVLQALLEQQRHQNELHKQLSLLGTEDQLLQQWELLQNQAQLSSLPCLDASICNRRLTQYLYHTRSRPINSDMTYWKKFVSEYYAPCAKQRLCFSTCVNVSQQALNLFTDTAMESWCCSICASKSSKGFEVIYETLPRLFKTKYESTMLDEILFLGVPREHRFPSGLIMLEYDKVVQEIIYEDFRIVHEGILRVIFRPDLKIFSWEFCVQRQEELLKHRSLARQVDHFVEAAQKYRSTINNLAGTSLKDIQSCCNMFLTAELELARNVELPLVNALGFSKKHFRCLQIAEIVGSMTDLITISHELGVGPIESLKNYRRLKEMKEQRTNHSVTSTDDGGLAADNSYYRPLRQGARSSVARTQVLQPSYSTANSSQLEFTANERMKSIEDTVDKLLSAKEATLKANSLGNAISEVNGTAISGAWPQISDTITLANAMNFGENAAALAVAQANLNLMANAQPSGAEMCKAAFNSSSSKVKMSVKVEPRIQEQV